MLLVFSNDYSFVLCCYPWLRRVLRNPVSCTSSTRRSVYSPTAVFVSYKTLLNNLNTHWRPSRISAKWL